MESERVKKLKQHIDECKNVLAENNPQKAVTKIERIKERYRNIRNFSTDTYKEYQLFDSPDAVGGAFVAPPNDSRQLEALENLIEEMELYLAELVDKQDKEPKKQSKAETIRIDNYNTNTANATINQNISIDSTIKAINELPSDILDEKDKKYLENILRDIDDLKGQNKEKAKNKIFEVLKYIIDKSIEVGIAILPYLGKIALFLKP